MNNVSPIQTSLRYGLILGLASILITVILYITDLMLNPVVGVIALVLFILLFTIIIVLSIRTHKIEKQSNQISVSKGFLTGLLTTIFASLLLFIFSYILYAFIDPDLIEAQLKMQEEMMENWGFMTDEQVEVTMENARSKASALRSASGISCYSCYGVVASLISALILKSDLVQDELI